MISDYKRLKSARNGLFIVMHGQCYDKMAEREAFSTRRVSYHVKLGQDNNKENLIQADISENDFEKCMLGTNMFAVRLVRKTKNGVEIDTETSAYLL